MSEVALGPLLDALRKADSPRFDLRPYGHVLSVGVDDLHGPLLALIEGGGLDAALDKVRLSVVLDQGPKLVVSRIDGGAIATIGGTF